MKEFFVEIANKFNDLGIYEISFLLIIAIVGNFLFKIFSLASQRTAFAIKRTGVAVKQSSHQRSKVVARENFVAIYRAIKNEGFLKQLEKSETYYFRKRIFLCLYIIITGIFLATFPEALEKSELEFERALWIMPAFAFLDGYWSGIQDRHGKTVTLANRIKHDKIYLPSRRDYKLRQKKMEQEKSD